MRVYKDGALSKSNVFTNFLVDEFIISVETTGSDASGINENNNIHNISIHTMVREVLLDSNQHVINGDVNQKHHQKYTYEKSIVK